MNKMTELRLQLLANGYTPLRNRDKACWLKGWPTLEIDTQLVESWDRIGRDKATGLRVENGLAVIDVDVQDADIVDAIFDALLTIAPELADESVPFLERHSGKAKVAWFFRTPEVFGRLHTRRWTRPGDKVDDGTQQVEIFGGGHARQFGAFGPHTVADDGSVLRSYGWSTLSPLDVPLDQLPVLSKAQFAALADAAENIMADAGWEPVLRSKAGENVETRLYDLRAGMEFDCNDGQTYTLEELRAVAEQAEGLRCSASWLEGPEATNRSRCLVSVTRSGFLSIWESSEGVTHVEERAAPHVTPEADLDRLAEFLRELKDRRRNRMTAGDDYQTALTKSLASYALCPPLNAVVPLWPMSVTEQETFGAFRLRLAKHGYTDDAGPRGGRGAFHNPADAWVRAEQLIVVDGVQMRPDMPRPTFEEEGRRYVNAYRPTVLTPEMAEGGSCELGRDFIARLVPDPAERHLTTQWLAHKLRYPHVPMFSLLMVANDTFGTGRNTLGDLMAELLGPSYVKEVPFETFTGKTYQSQYNEWQVDSLLVVVSESAESDGSTWATKRNTYERLKLIVDPRPGRRVQVNLKRSANFYATTCASYLIATNHRDALPLPETDRRFCVVMNGEAQPPSYWTELREWMGLRENIAAFAQYLAEVDLSDFNPYLPPLFRGKVRMANDSKSDLDEAFAIGMAALPGEIATLAQIEAAVRRAFAEHDLEQPNAALGSVLRKMVKRNLHRVGAAHGFNWFLKEGGTRHAMYARTDKVAMRYTNAERDVVSREVHRNGPADGGGGAIKGLP